MFHRYLSKMYDIPTYVYAIGILALVLIWAYLGERFRNNRTWIIVNGVAMCISFAAIFVITILVRTVQKTGIYLDPLYAFKLAQEFPDVYNQMMLNIVLFLPLGLTMPFVFKVRFPAILTIVISLLYSCVIECLQYYLSRGYFEVGDLILNTTGALLGIFAHWIPLWVRKKNKRSQ